MTNSKDERIEELKKAILELPEEQQRAVMCIASHYETIERICRAEKLTSEQREELIRDVREKGDALLLGMVLLERELNGE